MGFSRGEASTWFPQVDRRLTADQANSKSAADERAALVELRKKRSIHELKPLQAPPPDPTRQLFWDALSAEPQAKHEPAKTDVAWVKRLRDIKSALWVNQRDSSERFVFYEGKTQETPLLSLERGPAYKPGHRQLRVRNSSTSPVHDVFLTHREGQSFFAVHLDSIPAGGAAEVVLEDHATSGAKLAEATRELLRKGLVEGAPPKGPGCVEGRDPALPTEQATDHRLKPEEVQVLVDHWGARFFDASGTTLLYREDEAYLSSAVPLSVYTDMFHYVRLSRVSLGLVEGLSLP